MERILVIFFRLEIALGVIWTVFLIAGNHDGWGPVYAFFYIYPWHGIFMLTALVSLVTSPPTRRLAAKVFLLPIGLLFLPFILVKLFGGPLFDGSRGLLGAAAIAAAGVVFFSLVRPRTVGELLPTFMFRSRAFNVVVLTLPVLAWLPLLALFVWYFGIVDPADRSLGHDRESAAWGFAYALIGVSLYLGIVGIVSAPVFLQGYLGWRNADLSPHRKLHVAQMAVTLPAMILAGLAVALVMSITN